MDVLPGRQLVYIAEFRQAVVLCLVLCFYYAAANAHLYALSLHDALPICFTRGAFFQAGISATRRVFDECNLEHAPRRAEDRKSTRLNSSHTVSSYAVFCLKKKTSTGRQTRNWPSGSRTWPGRLWATGGSL